ncbi:MAG TPA: hypothetical protein VLM89_01010 [Phycisphaerae bacterium]|nr:hypothetical protein [Phycisphaerae bacterium]
MQSEWEVSRSTGQCAATGRPLAEGESYYAVLFETPEGLERRDFAADTWTEPPEGSFCYWRAQVPVKDKPSGPLVVDFELLLQLFIRLEEADSEVRRQFRFVLTLLLMRKRILRFEKAERRDGREYWVMRLASDQSEHRVLNPRLSEEEVARLSEQLTAILSGDARTLESLEREENQEDTADLPADAPAHANGTDISTPGAADAGSEGEIALQ